MDDVDEVSDDHEEGIRWLTLASQSGKNHQAKQVCLQRAIEHLTNALNSFKGTEKYPKAMRNLAMAHWLMAQSRQTTNLLPNKSEVGEFYCSAIECYAQFMADRSRPGDFDEEYNQCLGQALEWCEQLKPKEAMETIESYLKAIPARHGSARYSCLLKMSDILDYHANMTMGGAPADPGDSVKSSGRKTAEHHAGMNMGGVLADRGVANSVKKEATGSVFEGINVENNSPVMNKETREGTACHHNDSDLRDESIGHNNKKGALGVNASCDYQENVPVSADVTLSRELLGAAGELRISSDSDSETGSAMDIVDSGYHDLNPETNTRGDTVMGRLETKTNQVPDVVTSDDTTKVVTGDVTIEIAIGDVTTEVVTGDVITEPKDKNADDRKIPRQNFSSFAQSFYERLDASNMILDPGAARRETYESDDELASDNRTNDPDPAQEMPTKMTTVIEPGEASKVEGPNDKSEKQNSEDNTVYSTDVPSPQPSGSDLEDESLSPSEVLTILRRLQDPIHVQFTLADAAGLESLGILVELGRAKAYYKMPMARGSVHRRGVGSHDVIIQAIDRAFDKYRTPRYGKECLENIAAIHKHSAYQLLRTLHSVYVIITAMTPAFTPPSEQLKNLTRVLYALDKCIRCIDNDLVTARKNGNEGTAAILDHMTSVVKQAQTDLQIVSALDKSSGAHVQADVIHGLRELWEPFSRFVPEVNDCSSLSVLLSLRAALDLAVTHDKDDFILLIRKRLPYFETEPVVRECTTIILQETDNIRLLSLIIYGYPPSADWSFSEDELKALPRSKVRAIIDHVLKSYAPRKNIYEALSPVLFRIRDQLNRPIPE